MPSFALPFLRFVFNYSNKYFYYYHAADEENAMAFLLFFGDFMKLDNSKQRIEDYNYAKVLQSFMCPHEQD